MEPVELTCEQLPLAVSVKLPEEQRDALRWLVSCESALLAAKKRVLASTASKNRAGVAKGERWIKHDAASPLAIPLGGTATSKFPASWGAKQWVIAKRHADGSLKPASALSEGVLGIPRFRLFSHSYSENPVLTHWARSREIAALADWLWTQALEQSPPGARCRLAAAGGIVREAHAKLPGTSVAGWTSARLAVYSPGQRMPLHRDLGNLSGVLHAGCAVGIDASHPEDGAVRFVDDSGDCSVIVESGNACFSDFLCEHEVLPAERGRVSLLVWVEASALASASLVLEGEHAQEDLPRGAIVRRHPFLTRTHLRLRVSPIVHAIRHHRPCRQHGCAQRMPPSD